MVDNNTRPNPDELLARVKSEEAKAKRGKLKIFLGYAAGVGKTYAMLEDARERMQDTDLIVALVETHGRKETEALLEGLEILPRKTTEYHGIKLTEMDLDAVLARRPQLALVDELAHTNAPDSRHEKRYQDVEEILDAGIDVYTTLNIQHVESMRDVVTQITGVFIRETVPDTVIDNADEIKLVDFPPDELLKRLREGKVYVPEQIAHAVQDFFRKGNLTALRELTLRTAAERVDEQVRSYMKTENIPGPWPIGERIVVCISPSSLGSRLVRTGRRLATQLHAEWFAVYAETPANLRLSTREQDSLTSTMRLAERLGAKTVTIQGHSVSEAIVNYAKSNNITKIVVGKPARKRLFRLNDEVVVNRIIRQSKDIDVYVVSETTETAKPEREERIEPIRKWQGYIVGVILVVVSTVLGNFLSSVFSGANIIMVYLLCVAIVAIFWGLGPSIATAILSIIGFDFFLIPPYLTLAVENTTDIFNLIVLLVVGVIISYLTSRIREQTEMTKNRERQTATLYSLSRRLTNVGGLQETLNAIIDGIKDTFGTDVVIYLPDPSRKGNLLPNAGKLQTTVDENDLGAAVWSFEHQKTVGHGTDTLPNAIARFVPLITIRNTVGVIALKIDNPTEQITMERIRLIEAFADLAAVAIERAQLVEENRNAQILEESEKLQNAFLNSISNDLRTPLVSIISALNNLQEQGMTLNDSGRKSIQNAMKEADRLNHLVTNLLDVSRIEAKALKLNRQPADIIEIIRVAKEQVGSRHGEHQIKIRPPEIAKMLVDSHYMVQVFINLLDNAFKYSPPDSPIEISARQNGQEMEIEVADRGVGIPSRDLERVFDKFYRVEQPNYVTGTGLGLTICKGIIEAHGGHIVAENRPSGGTIIRLTLPLAK
jgi:two-component system, OmpR family, sensor histidine kinase KdpD